MSDPASAWQTRRTAADRARELAQVDAARAAADPGRFTNYVRAMYSLLQET